MTAYEYRVIPAPAKGVKAKGVKTPEDRFAHVLQELMNQMGAEGWEYQRAETLPSTERTGLAGSTTNWRHMLVFRRALREAGDMPDSKGIRTLGPIISPPRAPANNPGQKVASQDGAPEIIGKARDTGEAPGTDAPDRATRLDGLSATRNNPDKSDV